MDYISGYGKFELLLGYCIDVACSLVVTNSIKVDLLRPSGARAL
jgi:hypothetical protein